MSQADDNTTQTVNEFLDILEQEMKIVDGYKRDAAEHMMCSHPEVREMAAQKFFDYCNRMNGLHFAYHAIRHAHQPSTHTEELLACYKSGMQNSNGAKPYRTHVVE